MTVQRIDGLALAASVKAELAQRVEKLHQQGVTPGLGTLLVGDDPASAAYVAGKHRDSAQIGVASIQVVLPSNASEEEVLTAVAELNDRPDVTGFIVQLPMPGHINQRRILEAISVDKDADGLHPLNLGRLLSGTYREAGSPVPCTPAGILELLGDANIDLNGKHVVVIGRGLTVGRPLTALLMQQGIDATVTLTHSRTPDIETFTRQADVVIAAVGVPRMVTERGIRPGAILVDVGVSRIQEETAGASRLVGDIDDSATQIAAAYTPNPGGVGPMTRAMLLANVVRIAEMQLKGEHVHE